MIKAKHLPNCLSAARLPLALTLLPLPVLSAGFIIVYLVCCLTDVLDGYLARRLDARTELGARIDSAADFVLFAVLLIKLWPVVKPDAAITLCIIAVALMRLAAALTARVRFGTFGFLHTWTNKLAGGMLALYPISLLLTRGRLTLYILLAAAGVSAVEELLIELLAAQWDADRRSLLKIRKDTQ